MAQGALLSDLNGKEIQKREVMCTWISDSLLGTA